MSTALVSHTTTAAPLAALLPARRGVAWTVKPAPQAIRAGAAMSRLVQGDRALDVVELDGRVEVYADRADKAPVAPDVVVPETGPDPAAELAALVLRIVLPRLEREAARDTVVAHGREQVIIDGAQHLNEVGFSLIDHGAHVDPTGRPDGGVGIEWTTPNGAEWGLWVLPASGNLTLSYEGPVGGLYALLPVLLPTVDVSRPAFAGSAFTRHLTERFPQLHPLSADEVDFGRRDDVHGYIALPSNDEPTDYADDDRRVAACFSSLGADLLLTAVPHLV
ncbi:hypothetical protein AB0D65_29770 [Streptomyces griseoloalbus]|uniref:DUF317 domain-containing protein n=1 Tax=Streptomyces griseoloalbus TaxID=67303 RepID=A0ABV3EFX0_9ACTN